MSEPCGGGGGGEPAAPAGAAAGRAGSPRSFKLRFATQREPGRSYVSLVKPRGLPATVTGKFYTREAEREAQRARDSEPRPGTGAQAGVGRETVGGPECEREWRALRRIRDMFERGPRERLAHPLTSAHEYGWWVGSEPAARWQAAAEARGDRRRAHHIHDSAWLKARLRVLAADT